MGHPVPTMPGPYHTASPRRGPAEGGAGDATARIRFFIKARGGFDRIEVVRVGRQEPYGSGVPARDGPPDPTERRRRDHASFPWPRRVSRPA